MWWLWDLLPFFFFFLSTQKPTVAASDSCSDERMLLWRGRRQRNIPAVTPGLTNTLQRQSSGINNYLVMEFSVEKI